jgi:geranylgeranyl diphosphate synthase type II
MTPTRFQGYFQEQRTRIEQTLQHILPDASQPPKVIHEAMRYSIFAGGKRLRPILALAAFELASGGANSDEVLPIVAGLELIHTYSLIHDDLPCMDDDDLRRGRPTNHRVFGEGIAVLAGDALLTLAFECFLGTKTQKRFSPEILTALTTRIAKAAGSLGLVGGQVMDIQGFSRDGEFSTLETMCYLKTGRLIQVSLEIGAILAEATVDVFRAFESYGRALGLAFQVTDDILNVTGDSVALGKAVKSDASHQKTTFAELLGLEQARNRAKEYVEEARHALTSFNGSAWFLNDLADYVLNRRS